MPRNTPTRCRPQRPTLARRQREAILPQPQLRQPVVAAVESAQLIGQRLVIDTGHLAGVGFESNGLEGTGRQPGALLQQAASHGLGAATDATGRRVVRERNRSHAVPPIAARSVTGVRRAAQSASSRRGSTSR